MFEKSQMCPHPQIGKLAKMGKKNKRKLLLVDDVCTLEKTNDYGSLTWKDYKNNHLFYMN